MAGDGVRRGQTLAELVKRRRRRCRPTRPPDHPQAADALAAAHAAGIVHRDVKPSNMLVTAEGQVKLSDFGIARAQADPSLTQTGLVTGSPAYLAPEVAAGHSATDASDVWSLGASLFHALAGHPPYDVGDNLLGALYRIVHEEPPRIDDAGWLGAAARPHHDARAGRSLVDGPGAGLPGCRTAAAPHGSPPPRGRRGTGSRRTPAVGSGEHPGAAARPRPGPAHHRDSCCCG